MKIHQKNLWNDLVKNVSDHKFTSGPGLVFCGDLLVLFFFGLVWVCCLFDFVWVCVLVCLFLFGFVLFVCFPSQRETETERTTDIILVIWHCVSVAGYLILSSCFLFFPITWDCPDCSPWQTFSLFCPVQTRVEQPWPLYMQWITD